MTDVNAQPRGDRGRSSDASRFGRVVRYIRKNLDGDLRLEQLGRVARSSPFHLHRRFREHTGLPIARLVRLLRLRRASLWLAFAPRMSITDIALRSGYLNLESFSRAFRAACGQSPGEFRRGPTWRLWRTSRITHFQEHDLNREVEIVEFEPTAVAAVEYQGPEDECYAATLKLVAWRREHGVAPERGRTFGVHYTNPAMTPPEDFRLDVCVSYEPDIPPNAHGVVKKVIAGGRCARVRHFGSRDHIPEVQYLFREWLPQSGERLRDDPLFFHYVNVGPNVTDADMITDVYLPLK